MKILFLIICTYVFSTSIWAKNAWHCQNILSKKVCHGLDCGEHRVEQGAIHISLLKQNTVVICAKEHCWHGPTQKSAQHNIYTVTELEWKIENQPSQLFSLVIHPSQGQLYLESTNEKYPLQCRTA